MKRSAEHRVAWGPSACVLLALALAVMTLSGTSSAQNPEPSPSPSPTPSGCVWDPNCGALLPGEPSPSPTAMPSPVGTPTPSPQQTVTPTATAAPTDDPNAAGQNDDGSERPSDPRAPDDGTGAESSSAPDGFVSGSPDESPEGWSTEVPQFKALPGPRSTAEVLKLLEQKGIVADKAARILAPFPVFGAAMYSNDWHAPRYTPSFHLHQGTDIFAARGTPLLSAADGVITRVTPTSSVGGTSLWVTGEDGTGYYYAHLNAIAAGIRVGTKVRVGDLVGYVGSTGNAAGGAPHLHFEIHPKMGPAVEPLPYLDTWLYDALQKARGLPGGRTPTRLGNPELVAGWIPSPALTDRPQDAIDKTLSVMPVAGRTDSSSSAGTWPTILTLVIGPLIALRPRRRLDLNRIWREKR